MFIEVLLIILGILTFCLGLWNVIIGAYVWGSLFILSGLWSIWLGAVYIIQLRRQKNNKKATIEPSDVTELFEETLTDIENDHPVEDSPIEESFIFDPDMDDFEFDNAVSFTNEVIPTPTVSSAELDDLDENSQLDTDIDAIDPDIQVIQDLAQKDKSQDN